MSRGLSLHTLDKLAGPAYTCKLKAAQLSFLRVIFLIHMCQIFFLIPLLKNELLDLFHPFKQGV